MNAEHLHAIVTALSAEIQETEFPTRLEELVKGLRAAVETPNNPEPQAQISAAREALKAQLADAGSNDFPPAWQQDLEEMGISDLVGDPLLKEIESILSANEITPSTAADELSSISDRVQALVSALNEADRSLSFLRIGSEDLIPGEFEIGFMIPRAAVNSGLEELGKEFMELKAIIAPFSELVGEGRPEFKVRSISSSEFQVFLDSAPATAAVIATAADRLIAAYKNIIEIRELRKKMAERDVPDDALEGVSKHVSEGMGAKIREIVEQILAEAPSDGVDDARQNELKIEINLRLNQMAERIDRGYNVQVRTGELPQPIEGEEDEVALDDSTLRAVNVVLGKQETLEFVNVSGEPILKLEPPENLDSPER